MNIFQIYSKVGTYNTETSILSFPSQNTYTFNTYISISILLLSIKERKIVCCLLNKTMRW